jgi:outer membrane receptor for ferrienterochelin and colicins
MNKIKLLIFSFFITAVTFSQQLITFQVKDTLSSENLVGVAIQIKGTENGVITDEKGKASIKTNNKSIEIIFSYVGYKNKFLKIENTNIDSIIVVQLKPSSTELEEVYVSSTRTNSRIEELPLKVEVLGLEEMNEESTIVPGNITSLLGDLSIITIQRTSAVNANEELRMEGLDARYTQILRDGLPLFGGFSGSLGVLAIPPLDLKQVEIIKGSSSTLYGGGAIGGLINFISKIPENKPHTTIVASSGYPFQGNLNAYTSRKIKENGYTLFTGVNIRKATDINNDGFSDIPNDASFTIHPRYFLNFGKDKNVNFGFSGTYNKRSGGDIFAIEHSANANHPFLQTDEVFRGTVDGQLQMKINKHQMTAKAAVSGFNRDYTLTGFHFKGLQYNSFFELSDLVSFSRIDWISGVNLNAGSFRKLSSGNVLFKDYKNYTPGIFTQADIQITENISVEPGIRFDYQNNYGTFFLPRLALFIKSLKSFSFRLAYGTGYKTPELFDFAEPSVYLSGISDNIKIERSNGVNADINFKTLLFGNISFNIDQAFYYTSISNVNVLTTDSNRIQTIINSVSDAKSIGTDTYVRLTYDEFELYFGLNYTEAYETNSGKRIEIPFNPNFKASTLLAYVFNINWRVGLENSFTGKQYLYNNTRVSNYWFWAAMAERKIKWGSLVLNIEDLLDERQSRHETIVTGNTTNPIFSAPWLPLEGRLITLSLKIDF